MNLKKNIKEYNVEDLIIPIVKTSEEAAINFEDSVEFIFIDGAHEYDLVKLDFELWFPKLIDGGIIAFHDTKIFGGPKKVVEDYIFKSKYFKGVNFVDSITFATKVKKNFLKDRVKNIFVLFCKNISARSGARVGVKILPQTCARDQLRVIIICARRASTVFVAKIFSSRLQNWIMTQYGGKKSRRRLWVHIRRPYCGEEEEGCKAGYTTYRQP
jgi:hypothetical protein